MLGGAAKEHEHTQVRSRIRGRESRHASSQVRRGALNTAVALCLATALTHIGLVFLHVAPSNAVSQRFDSQVDAWIYPLFEQNWRLFAPDPDSVNRQISARTAHTAPDGSVHVGDWVDLTAVDSSAIEHNAFPSHTSQNMLRRSWTAYVELHGGDDRSRSDRAVMMQRYLRNIAADRMAERDGKPFENIQLRVVTLPVAAQGSADGGRSAAAVTAVKNAETRLLPWWKVSSDA
ncbi:hypothetical protein GCM10010253_47890 [Streptomyces badius]|uniref:Uncharacterized protein n=1 Tax=Streptomyces badius TaxID=1941 RepID=A0ABQ2TFA2_STRBA|nr:hypothetical protein GCM10010253_47890 [Streptomyces badius]